MINSKLFGKRLWMTGIKAKGKGQRAKVGFKNKDLRKA